MRFLKSTIGLLLKLIIIVIILLFLGFLVLSHMHAGDLEDMPELQTGDIVFQTPIDSQTPAIALASWSPYTHVGLVHVNNKGEAFVVEAAGPVRRVAFEKWIEQGIGERFTVKRYEALDPVRAEKVANEAYLHMDKPYDYLFTFSANSIYCSELVYYAFRDGADIPLGQVQKLGELNINNPLAERLIDARWKKHPKCQNLESKEACKAIIFEGEIITPASIADDIKLDMIYTNYGPLAQ